MTQPTNHWKLGLFVVVSFLLGLGALMYIGAKAFGRDAVTYKSYFDESVTGLDIGAIVRFRGVTLGTVSKIEVAPDKRHVEVSYGINSEAMANVGIVASNGDGGNSKIPPDLRAQISAQGLTGQKYILLDFFDPKANPVPKLPFTIPGNNIPAASSPLKNIEDSVARAVEKVPELTEQIGQLLATTNRLVESVHQRQFPERINETFDNLNATLANTNELIDALHTKVNQVPVAELSADARTAIQNVNVTMTKLQGVLDRVDGDEGLVASVQRATDSVGEAAGSAQLIGDDLSGTLREVREAAGALRQVLDALERDSDMLLKGRAELSE
jgi:phospholipid/cholesterol/gamma-HCH transport system substrate-binding protein